jgi:hypothetical protein
LLAQASPNRALPRSVVLFAAVEDRWRAVSHPTGSHAAAVKLNQFLASGRKSFGTAELAHPSHLISQRGTGTPFGDLRVSCPQNLPRDQGEKVNHAVGTLCRVLQVSRAAHYHWSTHPLSAPRARGHPRYPRRAFPGRLGAVRGTAAHGVGPSEPRGMGSRPCRRPRRRAVHSRVVARRGIHPLRSPQLRPRVAGGAPRRMITCSRARRPGQPEPTRADAEGSACRTGAPLTRGPR